MGDQGAYDGFGEEVGYFRGGFLFYYVGRDVKCSGYSGEGLRGVFNWFKEGFRVENGSSLHQS